MITPWGRKAKLSLIGAALLLPQLAYAGSFNIGSVSTSPIEETRKFSPFARYVAGQLQSAGVDQGKVVVAEGIAAMSALMRTRQVDLYIDSLFPSLAISRLAGSKFLLRRWKKGSSDYQAVIFARKDSGIARLEDLKGKMVAFEEPFSTTGYFFPKLKLMKAKFRVTPKGQSSDSVRPDEVGYVFSRGDTNTVFWVLNGAVAAGALDSDKYTQFAKNLGNLRVLHETDFLPRQIVSYRADLPETLVKKVREVLINMSQSDEGVKVLRDFENTAKFDAIPAQIFHRAAKWNPYIDAELQLQR